MNKRKQKKKKLKAKGWKVGTVDEFLELSKELSDPEVFICSDCGMEITEGLPYSFPSDENTYFHMEFDYCFKALKKEIKELNSYIDWMHKQQRRIYKNAEKEWQKATNQPNVSPDYGKLVEWIMEERKRCKRQQNEIQRGRKVALKASKLRLKEKNGTISRNRRASKERNSSAT